MWFIRQNASIQMWKWKLGFIDEKHCRGSSLEQKIEDYWKKRFAASVTLQNAGPETVCLGLSPNKGQCGEWLLLEYNWAVCSLTPVPRLVPVVCLPALSPHYILCIDSTIRLGVSSNKATFVDITRRVVKPFVSIRPLCFCCVFGDS